jgi:hypothetical protein
MDFTHTSALNFTHAHIKIEQIFMIAIGRSNFGPEIANLTVPDLLLWLSSLNRLPLLPLRA